MPCKFVCESLLVARYKDVLCFVAAFIFPFLLIKVPLLLKYCNKRCISWAVPTSNAHKSTNYLWFLLSGVLLAQMTLLNELLFGYILLLSPQLTDKIKAENFRHVWIAQ